MVSHASRSGGNTVEIRHPLRKEYNLSFHVKVESEKEPATISPKFEATIKIPLSLRQRHSIGGKAFEADIGKLLIEQGRLFDLSGIENPWHGESAEPIKPAVGERGDPTDSVDDASVEMTNALHLRLFERFVASSQRQQRYERGVSLSALFQEHGGFTRKKGKRSKRYQSFEVDTFIKNGNVMVKNLSASEELIALGRLRQFLLDFGELLNFRSDRWGKAIFIIESADEVMDRYRSGKKRPTFAYNLKDSFHIVTIPAKFNARALLEHLRLHIPYTKFE